MQQSRHVIDVTLEQHSRRERDRKGEKKKTGLLSLAAKNEKRSLHRAPSTEHSLHALYMAIRYIMRDISRNNTKRKYGEKVLLSQEKQCVCRLILKGFAHDILCIFDFDFCFDWPRQMPDKIQIGKYFKQSIIL